MGKIAVLGLGPSLGLFNPNDFDLTIGVNDIWSKYHSDYIVCVDAYQRFTPERLKIINESKPIKFYSQFPTKENPKATYWSDRDDYEHIELLPYYPDYICQLDTPKLPKSLCSPFIATVIAYKLLDATEIHLFGVDMDNHPNLKGKTLDKIKLHFTLLKQALRGKGVKLIIHGSGILKNI
jgi:hypothetical protein